ncbi:MAG: 5'-nucleotidase C-terminal domain-containing protein [Gammaproteobacteria bacterium]|nr:5'-nucleotidase C-terminal domain-containing protein [Gammaproteobacteria bacterium]
MSLSNHISTLSKRAAVCVLAFTMLGSGCVDPASKTTANDPGNTTGGTSNIEDLSGRSGPGTGPVTLIHIGDIHGHLVPRANVRSDSTGSMEGGLARMYTMISQLRLESIEDGVDRSLVVNTGDTLQGSGEALFSRGQAMIDVLNLFGIDVDTPGNWDFLYGPDRFLETFAGKNGSPPAVNWNPLAANLYYANQFDPTAVCGIADAAGNKFKRVLPTYQIRTIGKVKVGILGFTTARAIAAIGPKVTAGFQFTDGNIELPCYVYVLRNQEKVDLVVMISELEMARDVKLAETFAGVDVILNSDMHERTTTPIVTSKGTIIVEEGQDGTMIGELKLQVKKGQLDKWKWTPHVITERIPENTAISAKIAQVRAPFVKGTFVPDQKVSVGGNTTTLLRPVDDIIAYTQTALHRSNFVTEDMPGVVEGSSHDLIADAMRWAGMTDAAAVRGFRYGTNIPAGGPITMEDIYHFVPVAAKLGRGTKACGFDLKTQIENSTDGTFNPDPLKWTGGWMFGYSNISFDLDACAGYLNDGKLDRGTNIKVGGVLVDTKDTYDKTTQACTSGNPAYAVAGYWFAEDPGTINNCNACRGRLVQVVTNDGQVLDVNPAALPDSNTLLDITEAVVKYLQAATTAGGIGGVVTASNLPLHRITVKRLPTINPFQFNMIQPLLGATLVTCPAL